MIKRFIIGLALSLIVMACTPSDNIQDPIQPPATKSKKKTSASVVTLRKSPQDGQFWTNARVNTGNVKFLVDTGAGMVALTAKDAKTAGIKLRDLSFDVPISTAGGENKAAHVILDRVSVGAITLRDVDALVVPEGLDVSLLGMTYLGELQSVNTNRDTMTLRF